MRVKDEEPFLGIYLHANELNIANRFESVALTRLTYLNIFRHIFGAWFSLLGLMERLFALRAFEQKFIVWLRNWEAANKGSRKA